ncbi:MAG: CotH kinase family protein [Prevotellaceae bacterium]|nr:CotH kinase family protein [Prevotellaceae bacterium]
MSNNVSFVMDEKWNFSMWVELYNAGSSTENLNTYYFTDNLAEPQKWRPESQSVGASGFATLWFERNDFNGIPNPAHANFKLDPEGGVLYLLKSGGAIADSVTYPAQYRNVSYGRKTDGANEWVFFTEPSKAIGSNVTPGIEIISATATWNYWYKTATIPAGDWTSGSYNDAAWEKNKQAPLGYGKSSIKTTIGERNNPPVQTGYFRKKITIADKTAVTSLKVNASIDDGAVFYVNGTEVYRFNLPDGTISYTTPANTANGDPTSLDFDIPISLITNGENTIAVEVHQSADLNSSDFVFGLSMSYKLASSGDPTDSNNGKKYASAVCADPKFEKAAGFYTGSVSVTFTAPAAGEAIYYTTNGSEPTKASTLYTGTAITLTQTTPVRAVAIADNKISSKVVTATYFVNQREPALPVLSLTTNQEYFYDDEIGIYVTGTNGTRLPGQDCGNTANWFQDWNRPINFEIFDKDGAQRISQELDISISGQCSRNRGLRGFTISPRNKFGSNKLDYDIFTAKAGHKYKDIMLRAGGTEADCSTMRDALSQSVAAATNVDYLAYEPAVLFVNGEYWGIRNIRERSNKDFLYSNYGLGENDFFLYDRDNMFAGGSEFLSTYNAIMSNSLNYKQLCEQMDVDNYMDYIIAEQFSRNWDWPQNNIKVWKKKADGGKWRWILFDLDMSFGYLEFADQSFQTMVNGGPFANDPGSKFGQMFKTLTDNSDDFYTEFLARLCVRLSTVYAPDRVRHIVDSLVSKISPEMGYHKARWTSSECDFNNEVDLMRNRAQSRASAVWSDACSFFGLSCSRHNIKLSSNTGKATYKVYTTPVLQDAVTIQYFDSHPVKIEAERISGYQFQYWLKDAKDTIRNTVYSSNSVSANVTLQAVYEESEDDGFLKIYINEVSGNEEWIELYNAEASDVNLSGYTIRKVDEEGKVVNWDIPTGTTIEAKGFRTWTKGVGDGFTFGISAKKDVTFRLLENSGKKEIIDNFVITAPLYSEGDLRTVGRITDGADSLVIFLNGGTKNASNGGETDKPAPEKVEEGQAVGYPNPAKDNLNMALSKTMTSVDVTVYSMLGNPCSQQHYVNTSTVNVDISHCPAGLLVVRIQTEGEKDIVKRVLKL